MKLIPIRKLEDNARVNPMYFSSINLLLYAFVFFFNLRLFLALSFFRVLGSKHLVDPKFESRLVRGLFLFYCWLWSMEMKYLLP